MLVKSTPDEEKCGQTQLKTKSATTKKVNKETEIAIDV